MFSPPGAKFGKILSLNDITDYFDPNAKEVVEVGQGLKVNLTQLIYEYKTESEIQADCLDESLVGVARCTHILSKGAAIQRWSVLDSLWSLLECDGATAFDAIFPPLLKLLCTWDSELQIHAANIYTQILEKTKELGVRIKKRQEEDIYMYDPAELPPLPWQIDQGRIEKWILPTILLMADMEGTPEKEESAQHWLEPLFICMNMITIESVMDKILSFAIHKRDPTGSVTSRTAAAKLMGPLAKLLQPQQIQDKLFPSIISLCQDGNPHVRIVTCQQINPLIRCLMTSSTSSAGVAICSTSSSSLQLLQKILIELESILSKDDSIDVKIEAWKCLVDLLDFIPESLRKQRIIPLFKMYCSIPTTPANSHSIHSHSSAAAAANSSKSILNMLMKIFGEFLWKVSGDLATAGDEGANTLRFFLNWYKNTMTTAYMNVPSTFAPPIITPPITATPAPSSAGPTTTTSLAAANTAAATAALNSPPPANPDIELRRLAAFHFPSLIKICLGGHCGPGGGGAGLGPTANTSSTNYSLSSPSSVAAAAAAAIPSSLTPSSLTLPSKTLTLLDAFLTIYTRFANDPDSEVRRIAASSIHVIVTLWPGDLVLRSFKDIFLSFLLVSKQGVLVTESVLKNLDVVTDIFQQNKGDDPMAPMLGEMLRCITLYEASLGLNWRRKLVLLQQANRCYPKVFMLDLVNLHEKFIPILFESMKSGTVPLKLAAVETLVTFIKTFPYTYRRHELCARVAREFGMAKSYSSRMIYCEVVRMFFTKFSYKWIKRHIFAQFLTMFKNDPVSNVRRKFIEVLPLLKYTIKSTPSDQVLFEQFKSVISELSGAESSSPTAGDTDSIVKSSAQKLWEKMYAIEINTEYDRLNRKKEVEEDQMDREEENLAINLNLNSSLSNSNSNGTSASSSAATPRTTAANSDGTTEKAKGFGKRRNNSVIITSSISASSSTGKTSSSSKDANGLASPLSPNSGRPGTNAGGRGGGGKTKVGSISEGSPTSPSANGTYPLDSFEPLSPTAPKEKGLRNRTNSVTGTSSTSRPSSSSSNNNLSTPIPMPTPKSPNLNPSPIKLRPRSQSVLLSSTPINSSNDAPSPRPQLIQATSFEGVKEEDEVDADEAVDIEAKKSPTSPPPVTSPVSNTDPKHKRRPSTLSVATNNLQPISPTNGGLTITPRSPVPPLSVSPANNSMQLKSPNNVDKPSIISALLRGNSLGSNSDKLPTMSPNGHHSISYTTGQTPPGSDEPFSAPVYPHPSIHAGPRRSASPPPLMSVSAISSPLHSGNGASSGGNFSTTISGNRFRSSSTTQANSLTSSGAMSARSYSNSSSNSSSNSLSHSEEKLVLPKLGGNNFSVSPSHSSNSSTTGGLTPRIQRMNLHSTGSISSPNTSRSGVSGLPAASNSPTPPLTSSPMTQVHRTKRSPLVSSIEPTSHYPTTHTASISMNGSAAGGGLNPTTTGMNLLPLHGARTFNHTTTTTAATDTQRRFVAYDS